LRSATGDLIKLDPIRPSQLLALPRNGAGTQSRWKHTAEPVQFGALRQCIS
jgi:hypothetical protein